MRLKTDGRGSVKDVNVSLCDHARQSAYGHIVSRKAHTGPYKAITHHELDVENRGSSPIRTTGPSNQEISAAI
jgi:hypothetical protein